MSTRGPMGAAQWLFCLIIVLFFQESSQGPEISTVQFLASRKEELKRGPFTFPCRLPTLLGNRSCAGQMLAARKLRLKGGHDASRWVDYFPEEPRGFETGHPLSRPVGIADNEQDGDEGPSPAALAATAVEVRIAREKERLLRQQQAHERHEELQDAFKRMHKTEVTPVNHRKRQRGARKAMAGVPRRLWRELLHAGRCQFVNETTKDMCSKRHPSFGLPNGRGLFCKEHKEVFHVNVRSKVCVFEDCIKHPVFGDPNVGFARYCKQHRPEGFIDVINSRCRFDGGCSIQASFGPAGSFAPLFCLRHKLVHHINIRKSFCHFTDCTLQASFGFKGQRAKFCDQHRAAGMMRTYDRLCKSPHGCSRLPSFGPPGGKYLYCSVHKLPTDVNLRLDNEKKLQIQRTRKMCAHGNCTTKPLYGDAETKVVQFCSKHRADGHIDLVNKLCESANCTKRALFGCLPARGGVQFKNPLFCGSHRAEGHVDLRNNYRMCYFKGCHITASYRSPVEKHTETTNTSTQKKATTTPQRKSAGKPRYSCVSHKHDDDVPLHAKSGAGRGSGRATKEQEHF